MIDINKKYIFKGVEGIVLSVDRNHKEYPVVWLSDEGEVHYFTSAGHYPHDPNLNHLIEVKPTRWVNVHKHNTFGPYPSRADADNGARGDRIACVEVKEGDGL